jgi:hypothetical protein
MLLLTRQVKKMKSIENGNFVMDENILKINGCNDLRVLFLETGNAVLEL